MPLPDISGLTAAELNQLFGQVAEARARRQDSASERLADAASALSTLIGPDAPTAPSMSNLTSVQLYPDGQIASNVALAVRLNFRATEQLARIVRDIVTVVSR